MPSRVRIKVCGITRQGDATEAVAAGVDALGLNFHPPSPRAISLDRAREIVAALPPLVTTVGVFVDLSVERIREVVEATGISTVQLHGKEPAEFVARLAPLPVIRALRWPGATEGAALLDALHADCLAAGGLPAALLIDSRHETLAGGTGEKWNWSEAAPARFPRPILLAGGLNPDNVATAVRTLRPFAVDVASGVESAPGIKDAEKIRSFVAAVRQAEAEILRTSLDASEQ